MLEQARCSDVEYGSHCTQSRSKFTSEKRASNNFVLEYGCTNAKLVCSWEEFTDAVVKELKKKDGLVYMLWGKPAQSKWDDLVFSTIDTSIFLTWKYYRCSGIDQKRNVVLTCSHPSPLSAYKTSEPFVGSRYVTTRQIVKSLIMSETFTEYSLAAMKHWSKWVKSLLTGISGSFRKLCVEKR